MDPQQIKKRIEDLKARRIPAGDLPYETAAAMWQIALELNAISDEISGK